MSFFIDFFERWLGDLTGVMISFAGILLCVLAVGAFWDRRVKFPALIGWLCAGVAITSYPYLVSFSNPSQLLQSLHGLIGYVLFALTLVFFFIVFRRSWSIKVSDGYSEEPPVSSIFADETWGRSIRGTRLGAPIVILLASLAVLGTGLSAPQVMIGDEVTHYYMLAHQAKDLTQPNFFAEIPMAAGEPETRRYPHSFLWHYGGALLYALSGGSFAVIQFYQTFFLIQLLGVAYLLAKDRQGIETRSALAYVLVLASLPLSLIFSVAFYQDVPMTAQILTAFYLLRRNRWLLASLFMGLAIGIKVTAVLFFPAFFLLVLYWQIQRSGWLKGIPFFLCASAIVLGMTWSVGRAIVEYGNSEFYPQAQLERLIKKAKETIDSHLPNVSRVTGVAGLNTDLSARPVVRPEKAANAPVIIANHPGDLRIKENYLVYGGIVLWLVALYGLLGTITGRLFSRPSGAGREPSLWPYLVGGIYTVLTAWYIRTSPDARFFLPGLPFLLLPLLEKAVSLPKPKAFITILTALAVIQGGYVLQKTYRLRALTPEIQEGIRYLQENPPEGHIFMYPEGNYRFFPAQHEWYLDYRLREFWRADNDERIRLLRKFKVSLLVIKKHLIAPVDKEITNLGVYPVHFVKEIAADSRFKNVFENNQLLIYSVLPEETR